MQLVNPYYQAKMGNPKEINVKNHLLVGSGLPNFKEIRPSDITTSIPILLKKLNSEFCELEKRLNLKIEKFNECNWQDVMVPLYKLNEDLRWSWGVVCHLNGVNNTPEIRAAHSAIQPDVVRFINKLGQSKIVYKVAP